MFNVFITSQEIYWSTVRLLFCTKHAIRRWFCAQIRLSARRPPSLTFERLLNLYFTNHIRTGDRKEHLWRCSNSRSVKHYKNIFSNLILIRYKIISRIKFKITYQYTKTREIYIHHRLTGLNIFQDFLLATSDLLYKSEFAIQCTHHGRVAPYSYIISSPRGGLTADCQIARS